jgi:hypothetical protein
MPSASSPVASPGTAVVSFVTTSCAIRSDVAESAPVGPGWDAGNSDGSRLTVAAMVRTNNEIPRA